MLAEGLSVEDENDVPPRGVGVDDPPAAPEIQNESSDDDFTDSSDESSDDDGRKSPTWYVFHLFDQANHWKNMRELRQEHHRLLILENVRRLRRHLHWSLKNTK